MRGNNKRAVFRYNHEFRFLKLLLLRYKSKFEFLLYHYAIMNNHPHLLIKATEKTNISKLIQGIELAYYHYQHKRYGYTGHRWQGRFLSQVIEDEKYLFNSGIYIEKNPIKAGLVEKPEEYKWSSYRHYAFGETDPLIDNNPLYACLGKTDEECQKAYRELMAAAILADKNC